MSKSAFAKLLDEARDIVRVKERRQLELHFDWDGGDDKDSWMCWEGDAAEMGKVYRGSAGEEALRRLVEALRTQ